MPTALILDASSGPSVAAVRSLGRAGWRVLVPAGTRGERSRHASGTVMLPSPHDEPDRYCEALAGALAGVDVVAPAEDATVELVWRLGDALGTTRVLGADRVSAETYLDKAATLAAADRHGFPTPAWRAPRTREEAHDAAREIGFPCVVKPRRTFTLANGRLQLRRHAVVETPDGLDAALEARRDRDGSLPLVQALVPGRALSTTAVVQDGRIVGYAARETLSFHPIAGGTSVRKRTVPPDDAGVQEALALLRAIRFEGLGEVEFQVGADGVPRLMEIGVRLHGWVPLAIAAGVDLPLLAARALLGERLPEASGYRVGVQMRWPMGEVARVRDAFRQPSRLPPGVTRLDVVRSVWPPWAPGMLYDGIVADDLGPWLPFMRARRRSGAR
jgi:predicted ATP-grasp superfamily ATP-dependent carboligase